MNKKYTAEYRGYTINIYDEECYEILNPDGSLNYYDDNIEEEVDAQAVIIAAEIIIDYIVNSNSNDDKKEEL